MVIASCGSEASHGATLGCLPEFTNPRNCIQPFTTDPSQQQEPLGTQDLVCVREWCERCLTNYTSGSVSRFSQRSPAFKPRKLLHLWHHCAPLADWSGNARWSLSTGSTLGRLPSS